MLTTLALNPDKIGFMRRPEQAPAGPCLGCQLPVYTPLTVILTFDGQPICTTCVRTCLGEDAARATERASRQALELDHRTVTRAIESAADRFRVS